MAVKLPFRWFVEIEPFIDEKEQAWADYRIRRWIPVWARRWCRS